MVEKEAMITVCGRPNVGKSSLTNALVGEKIAIVSSKPQTTRNRIYGVVNSGGVQLVLVDTPGLHKAQNRLGDYMVKVVQESLSDIDAVMLLVEPVPHVGTPEQLILDRLKNSGEKAVLVINKIDTVKKEALLAVIAAYQDAYDFDAVIPVSARTGEGLDDLLQTLKGYAVEGPQLFPDGMTTDQPDIDLDVTIYCEKASHKGILIGKGGAMLKQISTMAREDIETFMGAKVFLQTWVKVKENWRDNVNYMRTFGYQEQ